MMIRRRGFTLLEVMLSLSLVVLFLSILFQFYRNTMEHRQRGLTAVQEAHLARVLLRQITDEIRAAGGFVPGFGPGVIGERYDLTMQTIDLPSQELLRKRDRFETPPPGPPGGPGSYRRPAGCFCAGRTVSRVGSGTAASAASAGSVAWSRRAAAAAVSTSPCGCSATADARSSWVSWVWPSKTLANSSRLDGSSQPASMRATPAATTVLEPTVRRARRAHSAPRGLGETGPPPSAFRRSGNVMRWPHTMFVKNAIRPPRMAGRRTAYRT